MADWGRVPTPWFGWAATLLELKEGEFPHLPTVAEALRGNEPLPREVREFLADYVEGVIQRPRGNTKYRDVNAVDAQIDFSYLRDTFEDVRERVKGRSNKGPGTPTEIALEQVARIVNRKFKTNLKPDGIKKMIRVRDRSKHKK